MSKPSEVQFDIHVGSCPEMSLRAAEATAARLASGRGCRWCLAARLLAEFCEYARTRRPPADVTRSLADRLEAILVTEPAPASCRACRRLRRGAHRFRARRYPAAGQPCARHALCEVHA